jgi:hypothetical protein
MPVVTTIYSSAWTNCSATYIRTADSTSNYYFEAIEIFVSTAGTYILSSNSSLDTYGYIYNNTFNTSNPAANLFSQDDDSAGNRQFKMAVYLRPDFMTYVLVATTHSAGMTGSFSIIASGPTKVILLRKNIITTTSKD